MGAKRVVSARELSLAEIKDGSALISRIDMEIESFIHGAMCISYSGRCLLSNFFTVVTPTRVPVPIHAAGNIPL